MKKTLYLLLLIILPSFIYSQNSWIFDDFNKTDGDYIYDIMQYGNSKFISLSANGKTLYHTLRIHDLKTGAILNEVNYTRNSVSLTELFMDKNNNEFYAFGISYFTKDSIEKGAFIMTKWDYNLNTIFEKVYNLPDNQSIYSLYGNKFENEIVFVCNVISDLGVITPNFFISIDFNGKITRFENMKNRYRIDNLVKKIGGHGYYGFGTIVYSFDDSLNVEFEDFNLIDHKGGGISWYGKIFDDSTYILGIPYDGNLSGIRVVKVNLDMTFRKQNVYQHKGRYTTLAQKGFDFYYKDALYLAATDYWDRSYFDISKFDSDLNLLWRKHIHFDEKDRYHMFSIEATSDGGAIICGSKEFYHKEAKIKFDSSRAFILKIAGDGTIVSNNELDETGWEVTVFPNPSQGDFKIEIAGDANKTKLKLFDLQGRKVKVYNNLISGSNHVNMHNLPKGIYVWKLEKEGKILGSGKWVKE